MHTHQLFLLPSQHPHSMTILIAFTLIFVFTTVPLSSFAQQEDADQQFHECRNNLYSCGQNIINVGYPFWARGRRPKACGLEGFELSCENDEYTTINIARQRFRVLSINTNVDPMRMRIARDDLWGEICPSGYINTTLNEELFHYSPNNTEYLTMYYSCPSEYRNMVFNDFPRNNLNCSVDGGERVSFFLERERSLPLDPFGLDPCEHNITVPVLKDAYDAAMRPQDMLNQGFDVEYGLNTSFLCLECEASGGLCFSPPQNSPPSCLCSNGNLRPFVCSRVIALTGVLATLSICSVIYCMRKSITCAALRISRTRKDKDIETFIRQYGSSVQKRYKYYDLQKVTNSFNDELGRGSYGSVYKGRMSNGSLVAVKVLNAAKGNGEDFINEVSSIGRTSHVNIVTLLGYCYEGKRRALIYEFMPNGSLDKFIYGHNPSTRVQDLGWEKLYEISLGIARGLEYLHRGCNTRILHLDIKPHNILLDKDFRPKIADFGLAKLYSSTGSIVSMTGARGTIGYVAPEVVCRNFGAVSHKSDVYSYGMMVLEMVGGRKNIDAGVVNLSEIYFPHWIYKHVLLEEDLQLKHIISPEEKEIARKMILVGLWCIQTDPSKRPSMSRVTEMLEGSTEALQVPPKPYLYSPEGTEVNSIA